MTRFVGNINWFGGFNSKIQKYNDFGYLVDVFSNEEIRVHCSQLLCQESDLNKGIYVSFEKGIFKGKPAAFKVKLLKDEDNEMLLKRCFSLDSDQVWLAIGNQLNYLASINEQIEILNAKVEKKLYHLLKYFPSSTLLHHDAKLIRTQTPVDLRFDILEEVANLPEFQDEILNAIRDQHYISSVENHPFWKSHVITGIDDLFLQAAPESVKKLLYKNYYQTAINLINQDYTANAIKAWDAISAYKDLTEQDKRLAFAWLPRDKRENKHEIAKMLSARTAEKIAMLFYKQYTANIADVAITQLDRQGSNWITHDLLIEGVIPVDIKNARTNTTTKSYSEHVVPKFKESRINQHVTIACVLSPYLQPEFIKNPETVKFNPDPITFLGETSYKEICDLEVKFSRNDIISFGIEIRDNLKVIPPWLLDYPDNYYFHSKKCRDQLHSIDLPSGEAWKIMGINPIYSYVTNGLSLPAEFKKNITTSEINFYDQILAITTKRKIKLPEIFLLVMTHFLISIHAENGHAFNPEKYFNILYNINCARKNNGPMENNNPLNVEDPLGIINDLCRTLIDLYINPISLEKVKRYREFKFSGLGLLSGRQNNSEKWSTIIAYCGGSIKNEGRKCGFSPLVVEKHKTCPKCKHLICPDCDYCSYNCSEILVRENARIPQYYVRPSKYDHLSTEEILDCIGAY